MISEFGSTADNTADKLHTQQEMLHTEKHCNQPSEGCPPVCTVSSSHLQNAGLLNLHPVFQMWLYYLADSAVPFGTRQELEKGACIGP